MYILSKTIYFLINPLTWIAAILIWALLTKMPEKRLKLLRIGIFTFLFFSLAPIFQLFNWLHEVPLTDIRTIKKKYDIGIVLGGYVDRGVRPQDRMHFTSSNTRLMTSIELYHKGIIKKLLLSGGAFGATKEQSEAYKVYHFLLTLGIPKEHIIVEYASLNTRENADFSKKLIDKDYSNASLLLITSAWHMRRAKGCFKKVGLTVDTFSTDPFDGKILTAPYYYFFPNASILEAWRVLTKEWFGLLFYKILGYI